jgi:hypothetical protein
MEKSDPLNSYKVINEIQGLPWTLSGYGSTLNTAKGGKSIIRSVLMWIEHPNLIRSRFHFKQVLLYTPRMTKTIKPPGVRWISQNQMAGCWNHIPWDPLRFHPWNDWYDPRSRWPTLRFRRPWHGRRMPWSGAVRGGPLEAFGAFRKAMICG